MLNNVKKQFVIQEHSIQNDIHWDLMLEHANTLLTWRINQHPAHIKTSPVLAEHIADHPIRFLTYEGPVQNNTGTVQIVDKGLLFLHQRTSSVITFELDGDLLNGHFTLRQNIANRWILQRQS